MAAAAPAAAPDAVEQVLSFLLLQQPHVRLTLQLWSCCKFSSDLAAALYLIGVVCNGEQLIDLSHVAVIRHTEDPST